LSFDNTLFIEPSVLDAWARFYAFDLRWVIMPIHRFIGYAPDGRKRCSCELTGKKWDNCNAGKPGKHPWKGWKQVPMDTPEQGYAAFRAVFDIYPHGVNIGVRTGRVSGIWAVDLDVGDEKNGIRDLESWMTKNGLGWNDMSTLTARTGGGGCHIVYSYPNATEKIRTVAPHSELGRAVDVKGDGGYILVAPSVHASGSMYAWHETPKRESILPAPDRLLHICETRPKQTFDAEYTPTLQELRGLADKLSRTKSQLSKIVGTNMLFALEGSPIAEDGGAHDAYRDIAWFIAQKYPTANPSTIADYLRESVEARYANKPNASTDISNILDSVHTALSKVQEKAKSWEGQVALNDKSMPIANDPNMLLFFRNHPAWHGVLGYNKRLNKPVYLEPPPIALNTQRGAPVDLMRDKSEIALWFQVHAQMRGRFTLTDVQSALVTSAWDNAFDPLIDAVMSLDGKWDGVPRLETALQRVAGAPDTWWTRRVFPLWMKSLVARILWPGCKCDTMLILEGKQGFKKSTFFASLLPDKQYFSDSIAKANHDNETIRLVHSGPAIFEIGELSALKRADVEEIKTFLSAFQDSLRPLYEAARMTPRRCVFVGTTNKDDYLRDETGGRRFWPVCVTRNIDIQTVVAEREMWFAEAIARLRAGEIWWLDEDDAEVARAEQALRLEEDIWLQPIAAWLADRADPNVTVESAKSGTEQMQALLNSKKAGDVVTVFQVAECALKMEIKNARGGEFNRITRILKYLDWVPDRRICNGKKARVWVRPNI
jgi:hypothetical protein